MTRAVVDRNCLSFWFPPLREAGLQVPHTRIVRTEIDLTSLLDGKTPEGFEAFVDELAVAGTQVGEGGPWFLRTGHGSGKHEWRDTCYVDGSEKLGWHVARLVEWSHTVDMFSLPHEVWVARELIPTIPLFRCEWYGGFPVTREFRVFIRDDVYEATYPYWPADAIEQGKPDNDDWRDLLAEASTLGEEDAATIAELAGQASGAVGGGYWSIDFLQDEEGEWWLTDMAEGGRSYRPEVQA